MEKNKAAQELAKKRWEGSTEDERSEFARQGAQAAAASMTPKQRIARAKKAVAAREAKRAASGKKAAKKKVSKK